MKMNRMKLVMIGNGMAGVRTLEELLKYAVEFKASDLHLTVGRPPMVRIQGRLVASGRGVFQRHLRILP